MRRSTLKPCWKCGANVQHYVRKNSFPSIGFPTQVIIHLLNQMCYWFRRNIGLKRRTIMNSVKDRKLLHE